MAAADNVALNSGASPAVPARTLPRCSTVALWRAHQRPAHLATSEDSCATGALRSTITTFFQWKYAAMTHYPTIPLPRSRVAYVATGRRAARTLPTTCCVGCRARGWQTRGAERALRRTRAALRTRASYRTMTTRNYDVASPARGTVPRSHVCRFFRRSLTRL